MKRLFSYLIAIMLFPQVSSAVILVQKPQKTFSVSQTYVITHNTHKSVSCIAPNIWAAYNTHNQNNAHMMLSRNVGPQKHIDQQKYAGGSTKYLAGGRMEQISNRRLAQVE